MKKIIKEILSNKAVRSSSVLMSLIAAVMTVGAPWLDK